MVTLIVEDDEATRELLEWVMAARGHTVVACGDGAEALAAASANPPALILLDWMLPAMTGIELCKSLRSHAKGEECVIMMLTAKGDPDDVKTALAAGADDYMLKPLDLRQLAIRLSVAERWVEQRRLWIEKLRAARRQP